MEASAMKSVLIASIAGLAFSASALGSVQFYQFAATGAELESNPTIVVNTAGGRLSNLDARFNPTTDRFNWNFTVSDGVAMDTDGYRLVVGPGPNPRISQFEYAIIYFDASNLSNPNVSIYRYNAENNTSSFSNPGDLLATNRMSGQSTIQASASQNGAARTFNLQVDAATINNLFGPPGQPDWQGIRFGEAQNPTNVTNKIGIWFHPVGGLTASYDNANQLTSFNVGTQGWYDGSNTTVVLVPAPASAAMLGLAGLFVARRRRTA
jgi:hypothetical protein